MAKRTRNYASVFYPDSAPENWNDIIASWKVPCFVSPLHEDDFNPGGEKKKAHYHILLMFEGVKTEEQARELLDQVNCVGLETVSSIRGYARYLCHLDNPEKAQYTTDQVICYSSADYHHVIGLPSDKYKAIREITDFCRDNDIYSYAQLFDYCAVHKFDWFKCLCDNGTYVVREYLKSRTWDANQDKDFLVEPIGEPYPYSEEDE